MKKKATGDECLRNGGGGDFEWLIYVNVEVTQIVAEFEIERKRF